MKNNALNTQEVRDFLKDVFPQIDGEMFVDEIAPMTARVSLPIKEKHLRPGGTVSGPAMMALVDCGFYAASLGMIGREALTVTTNLNINFLRKPASDTDMYVDARILKLGKLLITGDATVYSVGMENPVAHATLTYAVPPK